MNESLNIHPLFKLPKDPMLAIGEFSHDAKLYAENNNKMLIDANNMLLNLIQQIQQQNILLQQILQELQK